MFLLSDLVVTDKHQEYVDLVLSANFPLYCQITIDSDRPSMIFSHGLMGRNESESQSVGVINSAFYQESIRFFDSFCVQNGVEYSCIFRASINCTVYAKDTAVKIHRDHEFHHNVFICYLNDSDGDTNIYDENDNLIHSVSPKQFRGLFFSGEPHNHNHCKPDVRRVVLVVTFI